MSRVAAAQVGGDDDDEKTGKRLAADTTPALFVADVAKTLVHVIGPQRVQVDPQTKIAKVRLYNPSPDTEKVTLELRFMLPPSRKRMYAEDLLSPRQAIEADSMAKEADRRDSLERAWSLTNWVREPLPIRIWLAPHQRVMVTLHLNVPDGLQPGEYSAYLIANDDHGLWMATKDGTLPFVVPDDKLPPVAAQLIYTVQATSP